MLDFNTSVDVLGDVWIRSEAVRSFVKKLVDEKIYSPSALTDFDEMCEHARTQASIKPQGDIL